VAPAPPPHTLARIPRALLSRIEAAAQEAYPNECCGLLIGRQNDAVFEITRIAESRNIALSPRDRFEIAPALQFHWQRHLRGTAESVIGHYHSHPEGPAAPSATDIIEANDPALLWLITSPATEPPTTNAVTIRNGIPQPVTRDRDSH
jgi:proteasome lid subunit RPN8/RPN11